MGCDSQFDGLYDSPRSIFDEEWYRLGFNEVNHSIHGDWVKSYECQGCFCLTVSYKAHWDACDKAVKRSREIKLEKK
jgi:hypothetical protein